MVVDCCLVVEGFYCLWVGFEEFFEEVVLDVFVDGVECVVLYCILDVFLGLVCVHGWDVVVWVACVVS